MADTRRVQLAVTFALLALVLGAISTSAIAAYAGEIPQKSGYQVLRPITHGNLTVFPIAAANSHDTSGFITLDEGLRSGEVVITEAGRIPPLMRRRSTRSVPDTGAEVNRLVLINNSDRPLILLAGEIVTGGKQDRIVGKDRIVPPGGDPVDVAVFCVEPGRWVEKTASFNGLNSQMAQPSVRKEAMAKKDQQGVWNQVRETSVQVTAAAPQIATELSGSTSYATLVDNKTVHQQVDSVAAPIQHSYEGLMRQLKDRKAVGVVVAVNGQIIWADIFASTQLLEKYWPKLVRSYATEAVAFGNNGASVDIGDAESFLASMEGRREVVETEPGVYRHTEIAGSGFKVFELTSLLSKNAFDVHVAKMRDTEVSSQLRPMQE